MAAGTAHGFHIYSGMLLKLRIITSSWYTYYPGPGPGPIIVHKRTGILEVTYATSVYASESRGICNYVF